MSTNACYELAITTNFLISSRKASMARLPLGLGAKGGVGDYSVVNTVSTRLAVHLTSDISSSGRMLREDPSALDCTEGV